MTNGTTTTLGQHAEPSQPSARSHVSRACGRCRRAKAKCDGKQPCSNCQRSLSQCTYTTQDLRLKEHRMPASSVADLQAHKRLLNYVWDAIQKGGDEDILNEIRSGASIDDIVRGYTDLDLHDSPLTESSSSSRGSGVQPSRANVQQVVRPNIVPDSASTSYRAETFPYDTARLPLALERHQSASQSSWTDPVQAQQLGSQPSQDGETDVAQLSREELQPKHSSVLVPAQGASICKSQKSARHPSSFSFQPLPGSRQENPMYLRDGHSAQSQKYLRQTREVHLPETRKRSHRIAFLPIGSTRGFGNLPFSSAVTANHYPPSQQNAQLKVLRQPEWQIMPHWTYDDSALGRVYTGFQNTSVESSSRVLCGKQGLPLVNVTLFLRDRGPNDPHTPDSWASQVQRTFTGQMPQTTLLAGAYILSKLMTWLTNPTPETYAAVPIVIRPTTRQRMLPHPSSIDLVTTGPLRDALIERMRDFVPSIIQAGATVNWTQTVNEALIGLQYFNEHGVEEQEYYISPDFADHVADQRNWTFGRKILEAFPELAESELISRTEDVVKDVDRYA